MPVHDKITFNHGENEKTVQIKLVNERNRQIESKTIGTTKIDEDDKEDEEDQEDIPDVMFKVRIDKAEPNLVKVSKKNVCFVTINNSTDN